MSNFIYIIFTNSFIILIFKVVYFTKQFDFISTISKIFQRNVFVFITVPAIFFNNLKINFLPED